MPHVIEPANSGRARCRGCKKSIAKGELRLGERLPNPFADGEMTHWYHPPCAAYKRPQAFLDALEQTGVAVDDARRLSEAARRGVAHHRLPRIDGAERAGTGRARCRSCRSPIAKDAWRIRLVFYDESRFQPSGFVHAGCAATYFETDRVLDAVRHFSDGLEEGDLEAFTLALRQPPG